MYVYNIVCICAGGRNVLITQLFILPVCIYRHPVRLYMYMSYGVNLYVCLSCMCIVCTSPGCTVERPHGRAPFQVKESNKQNVTGII